MLDQHRKENMREIDTLHQQISTQEKHYARQLQDAFEEKQALLKEVHVEKAQVQKEQ